LLIKKPKASIEPAVISVTKFEEGSLFYYLWQTRNRNSKKSVWRCIYRI